MTTDEIAMRCELAVDPCRELDAEIWRACPTYGGSRADPYWAPRFTASVDTAMTLIPKGMDWRVDTMTGLPGAIVCVPNAWLSHKTAPRMVHGATPALALCAAALRARSAVGNAQDQNR